MLNGAELAEAVRRRSAGRTRVVYGIGAAMEDRDDAAERVLRLGDEREIARGLASGRFPEGAYR